MIQNAKTLFSSFLPVEYHAGTPAEYCSTAFALVAVSIFVLRSEVGPFDRGVV